MVDLTELKRLMAEATPGPFDYLPIESNVRGQSGVAICNTDSAGNFSDAEGELIAALRNKAPDMIAELERLREAIRPITGAELLASHSPTISDVIQYERQEAYAKGFADMRERAATAAHMDMRFTLAEEIRAMKPERE